MLVATLCLSLSLLGVVAWWVATTAKPIRRPKRRQATVEPDLDANNFKVDHPDQFPL